MNAINHLSIIDTAKHFQFFQMEKSVVNLSLIPQNI